MRTSWNAVVLAMGLGACSSLNPIDRTPSVNGLGGVGGSSSGAGGSAGSGGATAVSSGLPCEIRAILVSYCDSCHGAAPVGGAPRSLVTYDDLTRPDLTRNDRRMDLYAGLGVITFDGPQGHGFFKGGHDGQTANTMVCVEARQRCVVILSNDVRAEAMFPGIVRNILGETGAPWAWEYGPQPWTRP